MFRTETAVHLCGSSKQGVLEKLEKLYIALFYQDLYSISIDVFDDLVELMPVLSLSVCALLLFYRKKSISPPHLWGLDYITPNLSNSLYYP
jgi:hypothetical protein